jgi:predicted Zn-dependent protease
VYRPQANVAKVLKRVTVADRIASNANMEGLAAIVQMIVLAVGGMSLNAQQPTAPAQNSGSLDSAEKEAALGKQLAAEFEGRVSLIDSPGVQKYIDSVGQRLAAMMPAAQHPFLFRLIADDPCRSTHEPVALPGGYIFVPTALFIAAHDGAEFAGMLAHAMEHIAQQHALRQTDRGAVNIARMPLVFIGGWAGNCTQGAVPSGFIEAQRSLELDADSRAVQAMADAGIDPQGLLRYMERVQAPSDAASQKYAPLPVRDRRIAAILAAIEKAPPTSTRNALPTGFPSALEEVRRLADAMPGVGPENRPPSLRRQQP